MVGTHGYAAPDYIETGHLTSKSDVWSFGVVLYEVLTGRRCLDRNRPREEQKLLEWVKRFPAETKRFTMIIDPRLEHQYSSSAARKIAKLADNCMVKNPKERPTMSEVVERLKQIIQQSTKENPSEKSLEFVEKETADSDEKPDEIGPSKSWKRRMTQLAKLGEHVEGTDRRRRLFMQRAKVN